MLSVAVWLLFDMCCCFWMFLLLGNALGYVGLLLADLGCLFVLWGACCCFVFVVCLLLFVAWGAVGCCWLLLVALNVFGCVGMRWVAV